MLSYQHSYHAGNLADVHKHALLAWMLAYMAQKDKPLSYIETHAGRAVYDLAGPEAAKTGEAATGIGRVANWFNDHPFGRVLDAAAPHYPGSPLIAGTLLRDSDTLALAELHPQENTALAEAMLPFPAMVKQIDGFQLAMSITPPSPRRGLLLCDPSYEVKADYAAIPDFLAKIHRRWPVGVLVVWYPILVDARHKPMIKALRSAIPDGDVSEVAFAPARPGHGMIGSGLFVVNAPYGFDAEESRLSNLFKKLEN
ncbi:23S rRNA (adenine2030-N6)-methyltransferase [Cognatiyoonia koreensis]|uniref:Ribosomal RNA large subunit methyltransferase J n=1 Tax=Cognatiyoonia koreensis TaxID=364200 RepID=A0A1I0Q683_9RHOB|nr:23S rRNA (adenine(2030)-N(6))-methyltransferase RlmJ [Cognatiyoonia koreensis]SEW22500.1 23S rRNA (adenine2030-N6)-methyltransferase [Cognatiyoonia koreensis]